MFSTEAPDRLSFTGIAARNGSAEEGAKYQTSL